MTQKVLVTGAAGLLGRQIVRSFSRGVELRPTDRMECDVTSLTELRREIESFRPDLVLHCAAFTAVDRAESEREEAFLLNETGTRNVARVCREAGALLVTYGTDYVFDGRGRRPYREEDEPNPLSVYGESKLAAEWALAEESPEWLLIRTQWLFGEGGPDFVSAILGKADRKEALRVVSDQVGCPTFAPDLAEATRRLLAAGARGIVHFSNAGHTSFYEYAVFLLAEAGRGGTRAEPVKTADLLEGDYPALRPLYSVLDKTKYTAITGSAPRHWRKAVRKYLGTSQAGGIS
jgi:dTDP-4-dehydrorhamnose reductase